MGSLKSLIETIVKQELDELAINMSQVQHLCLSDVGNGRLVLYSGEALKDYIKATTTGQKPNKNAHKEIVYGVIKGIPKRECGAIEVVISAAHHGYGPLMYDIIASTVHPNYIMSDRFSTSKEAQNVWKFIFNNRRGEYEIKPLSNEDCKQEETDVDFLNCKYKIINPLNTDKLEHNGNQAVDNIFEETGYNFAYTLDNLKSLSELLFNQTVKDEG
jgi:hypothetical protein